MATKGQDTRQDIVEKALQLFSVKGYHNTSVNDLLAATGLTKGGLYGHFGSKEEIWNAAYDRAVEIWQEIAFRGLREVRDPLERVQRLIEQDLGSTWAAAFSTGLLLPEPPRGALGPGAGHDRPDPEGFRRLREETRGWFAEARQNGTLRPRQTRRRWPSSWSPPERRGCSLRGRPEPAAIERTLRHLEHYVASWRA